MDEVIEIYEKLKDRMSLEEFISLVKEKESYLSGLADKKTAAMLVAHDLGVDSDQKKISEISADTQQATVVGKVVSCSDVRTFNREDGSSGSVSNLTLADETGTIRVVLWDQAADLVKIGEIVFGDDLQVSGMVREGRNGLEISVGRGGKVDKVALKEKIKVRTDPYQINEIKAGMGDIHLLGKILDISDTRTFKRKDGTAGNVRSLVLGDATGKIRATLWDEKAGAAEQMAVGDTCEITGGYAQLNSFNDKVEIHIRSTSTLRKSSKQVEFREQITPIADIEVNGYYSIVGYVSGLDEIREFQKKDGTPGRVVNIHVSDDTGRIRISLWDDLVDLVHDMDIGTKLQITEVYSKTGFNDEVELSAGKRSILTLLEK